MTYTAVASCSRLHRPVRRIATAVALLLVVLATSCKKKPEPPPGVVASIGDRLVTADDFKRYLERNAGAPLTQLAPEAASALFDQYLDELLLSEEASARGLDVATPDVARALQNDSGASPVEKRDELRRSRLVSDISAKMPGPSEAEIEQYYKQHPEEFRTGEQVRARQILVHDEREANKALAELRRGAAFEEVSRKYSRAPNASRGGDIGFIGRGQLPRVFEDAIFGLKAGEVSNVIRTDGNFFHIFKVDEIVAPGDVSFAAARPLIDQKLREERLRGELEQLREAARKRFEVQVYTNRLGFNYRGKYRQEGE